MSSPISSDSTWEQIRNLYCSMCEDRTSARQEAWVHLSRAYTDVLAASDVPEVYVPEARVNVGADAVDGGFLDYILVDCDLYHVDAVFNLTLGRLMHPEPSGWAGRLRYLQEEGVSLRSKPPAGEAQFWIRYGNRIFIRDTPSAATALQVSYRRQRQNLDNTFVDEHPITPTQLDMAIAYHAASHYYKSHPKENTEQGRGLRSDFYEREGDKVLSRPKDVEGEEVKSQYYPRRLAGFRYTPRSW